MNRPNKKVQFASVADQPRRHIPPKAKTIITISKIDIRSPSQQKARIAVVKIFELKTTKKIPRGRYLGAAAKHKKEIVPKMDRSKSVGARCLGIL